MELNFPRKNNLEWLRLWFATQVVLDHGAEHLGFTLPRFINYFPGVPAFFFVSGFLIYASYLNSQGRNYFTNRFLRLFPGLFFVTLGGALVMLYARGWTDIMTHAGSYAIWLISQLTLGQAYNPSLFREVGVGVVNGSLWTITVEILFYMCVPVIVFLERRFRYVLPLLTALSLFFYLVAPHVWHEPIYRDKTVAEFLEITPIIWGWMFATGMLAFKYFEVYRSWIKFFPVILPVMFVMIMYGHGNLLTATGNDLGPFYFLCYVAMILWFAFGIGYIRLPFDFSYGVYIWHMPVINLLIVVSVKELWLAVVMTFCAAAVSWYFIEKPALKLKRQSLKPVK